MDDHKNLKTDLQLAHINKEQTANSVIRSYFSKLCNKYVNTQHIYTDGSKKTGCAFTTNNNKKIPDSKSAVQELQKLFPTNTISKENIYTIVWIPGHTGIPRNDLADQLAKE